MHFASPLLVESLVDSGSGLRAFGSGASEYILKFFNEVKVMAASVKWCCTAFENHFLMAGGRSIAVLVDRDSDGDPEFVLQSRAFSRDEEPPILDLPVPISRVIETGLNFCPWCGVPLSKWYKKHIDALRRPGLRIDVQ